MHLCEITVSAMRIIKPEYQTTLENAEDAVYNLQYQILS